MLKIEDLPQEQELSSDEMGKVAGGSLRELVLNAVQQGSASSSGSGSGSGSGPVTPTFQLSCANGRHFTNATLY